MTTAEVSTKRKILLSVWAVVLIGLPFWWKTTQVYRAHLPFEEIAHWQDLDGCLNFPVRVNLHLPSTEETRTLDLSDITRDVQKYVDTQSESNMNNRLINTSLGQVRVPVQLSSQIDTSEKIEESEVNGEYHIYVRSVGKSSDSKPRVLLHDSRSIIIEAQSIDRDTIVKTTSTVISELFTEEETKIAKTLNDDHNSDKVDAESLRVMKYASSYQLTFSLMNEDPSTLLVSWEIDAALREYLYPFLSELTKISNFTVESQIQNYATLTVEPQRQNTKKSHYYYLNPESLPHFINSAEWNLASAVSTSPSINFLIYVAAERHRPLRIHSAKGQRISNSAFLIPRYGGVAISNPKVGASQTSQKSHHFTPQELRQYMQTFTVQLRELLGIDEIRTIFQRAEIDVALVSTSGVGVTQWELDRLAHKRTAQNMVSAAATLSSLSRLINQIPNMVVLDHIQTEVTEALGSLQKACHHVKNMDYQKALHFSKEALERSESAFFDPTMVSMLYFPDEHKYAIYMPLFFPISVPLVLAAIKELKEMRKRKKEKAE
ncbi:GPI transamidase component [Basidiobolus ranarum]|uniref:GPI transamidase component n=1 Tax=Basidiobolus ranarum TaxID=34480 RepID=A0ABR2WL40_9FUNG